MKRLLFVPFGKFGKFGKWIEKKKSCLVLIPLSLGELKIDANFFYFATVK